MAKVALLVGISDYQPGLTPLPGATRDIDAMHQVLQDKSMGGFDRVQRLENPDPFTLQEAVEVLFSGRKKDDLALFFFSGHGIKDDVGRLYFATPLTRKNEKGSLVKATAVPASFLHDVMSSSRCKRQVVLLDCCFSGAFAEGMRAKDDGTVDLEAALGGEGRAVLTSSSSTQYSFEQAGEALSIYTRFIVEGIRTGAADEDRDGFVSIDELHEYASSKVHDAAPAMKPKIYAVEEGFKIHLAKAPMDDPTLRYRREVEQFASRGEISAIGRSTLDILKAEIGISAKEADQIEAEVLEPYREYQQRLGQYDQAFATAARQKQPITTITRRELDRYQEVLGLEDKDIAAIEARHLPVAPTTTKRENFSPEAQTEAAAPDAAPAAPKASSGRVAVGVKEAPRPSEPASPPPTNNNSRQLGKPLMVGGVLVAIAAAGIAAVALRSEPEPTAPKNGLEHHVAFEELIENRYELLEVSPLVETGGEFATFESPEGNFAGSYNTLLPAPMLEDRSDLKEYVIDVLLDDPTVQDVRVTSDACPTLDNFVCLTYDGESAETDEPVKGEFIVEQIEDEQTLLDTLNLYSVGRPQPSHGRQFDELIEAFFDVPSRQLRPRTPNP